jgi:membrane fusion protein, multidrug efflux system
MFGSLRRGFFEALEHAPKRLPSRRRNRRAIIRKAGRQSIAVSMSSSKVPFDGEVVGLNISEGYYAHAGTQVFDFLDARKWYVLANFRERELKSIRPGMKAEIYLLSNPDRRFSGTVEGISPAVQSQDNNGAVEGVPFVQRDLDWVRIAQRFPVRILIENPDPAVFRTGTTAVTTIKGYPQSGGRK